MKESKMQALTESAQQAASVGQAMPNGAILVVSKPADRNEDGELSVVLAVRSGRGHHPYVVWTRFIGVSPRATEGWQYEDYCFSGGYFYDFESALAHYNDRRR